MGVANWSTIMSATSTSATGSLECFSRIPPLFRQFWFTSEPFQTYLLWKAGVVCTPADIHSKVGEDMAKVAAVKKAMTKTEVLNAIAENTGLSRKDVAGVIDELGVVIGRHLGKGGAGSFTLPGLLKIKTVKKPATKARKGVPNPFRPGELMDVAAKPASTRVRVLPLKKLKEMV